ncbi:Phage protein D [Actinobacillus equuli]|nr:Phage protein D [Actinobacillus equuli]
MKLKVVGKIKHIPIQRVTQYQERDVEFLSRLAREYHHCFKIVGEQLVFSDKSDLGMAAPVAVLDESQCKTIRLRDRIKDAAKQVDVSGFDVNGKQVVKKQRKTRVTKNIKQAQTSNEDTLKIVTRGESYEQIDARAQAALEAQDEERCAGEITIIGNPKLVAGSTIMLRNLGIFSGKYLINHHDTLLLGARLYYKY